MNYKIAGVPVSITGDLSVHNAMKKYKSHDISDAINIHCCVKEQIAANKLTAIYGIKNHIEEYGKSGNIYISQDREKDISYATAMYSDDFRHISCDLVDVEALGGNNIADRMMVAIGGCFLNCLPAFGGITFHASCISYKGGALLFSAPSGTGKSTHTGLWQKCYPHDVAYINDDTPVLKEKDGVFYAFGTPWAGTSGINNNLSAPVKAIIYLVRDTTNSIRRLSEKESIIKALQSVRPQFFPIQRERQIRIVFSCVRSVPAYELRCNISEKAVEVVKSSLYD